MFLVNKSHCQRVGHCAGCWVDRHKEGLVPALKDTRFTDGSGARCKPSPLYLSIQLFSFCKSSLC